jgi:tetratricopeptide (TPR) repeat protein
LHALDDSSPLTAATAAGWLEPPLAGLDEAAVLQSKKMAPEGRARNRARLIRTLGRKGGHSVSWDTVYDRGRSRRAEIPRDPAWSGRVRWQVRGTFSRGAVERASIPKLLSLLAAHRAPSTFDECFRHGDYREALQFVTVGGARIAPGVDRASAILSYARMGHVTEARQALSLSAADRADPFITIAMKLFCESNFGLVPPLGACEPLIEEGERLRPDFGDENPEPDYWRAVFNQCRGWVRLHEGRYPEAIEALKAAIAQLEQPWRPRMLARTWCFLAEALRRKGSLVAARKELALPARAYLSQGLAGDATDHFLPVRAKLGDRRLAGRILCTAVEVDRRRGHDLALARTLCLAARVTKDRSAESELLRLAQTVEALRTCPLMRRILENWTTWVEGERRGDEDEDEYWGL